MSVRVLIAVDHALVRAGVRGLLAGAAELEVEGEVADGTEALRLARELQPQVLVLDLNMPGLDGFEVLRRVCAEVSGVRVLVLTTRTTSPQRFFSLVAIRCRCRCLGGARWRGLGLEDYQIWNRLHDSTHQI